MVKRLAALVLAVMSCTVVFALAPCSDSLKGASGELKVTRLGHTSVRFESQ